MNDHQRRAEELRRQRTQFASAFAQGQTAAVDRFGRKIEPAQKLLVKTDIDVDWTVIGVVPVLDPNLPPGLIDVTVTATIPLRVRAGQPWPQAVIIGTTAPAASNGTGGRLVESDPAEAPAGIVTPFRPSLDDPPE